MKHGEPYDDPILAARTRGWMQASAPIAAPERLVFSVMDEVARSPRTRRFGIPAVPILTGVARYAALTLVITIGVAAGILVTRSFEGVGGPTPAPTPTPSLRFVGNVSDHGRLLTNNTNRAWLVTGASELIPIEGDGTPGEPIAIDFAPSDVQTVIDPSRVYGGPETVWLIAPGADLLRVDPTVGEFVAAPGVRGTRVFLGAGAAWVSEAGEIHMVHADTMEVTTTYTVETHRAADAFLVAGGALWVADPAGIERIDIATGNRATRIPGTPAALLAAGDLIWVAQGPRLIGMGTVSGSVVRTVSLPSGAGTIVAMATHGNTVWLATGPGPGGPLLVGVEASTGQVISLTPVPTAPISIAVVGNEVWTLDAAGHVGRFEPG